MPQYSQIKRTGSESAAVRIPKVAELVANDLRNQIIRGVLKQGDSLTSESDLMARFGVSRPTLREALRVLESEGLVELSRGCRGGASVLGPSIDAAARHIGLVLQINGTTLADIYRVHMIVEPIAARIVAKDYHKTAPRILRERVNESRAQIGKDFEFGIATARFRTTLVELANVPTLTLLMSMLSQIFERSWGTITATAGRQLDNAPDKRRGLRSMEKLVDFIEAGDASGAETHWRKHTQAVEATMAKWLPTTKVVDILDT